MKAIKTIAAAGLLLGTTSVMAAPGPYVEPTDHTDFSTTSKAKFTFEIENSFHIFCVDATPVTELDKMIVPTAAALATAEATITCHAITNNNIWDLNLSTDNNGKMLTAANDTLKLYNFETQNFVDGVLGMYIDFKSATHNASVSTIDIQNKVVTLTKNMIANGGPGTDPGTIINEGDENKYKTPISLSKEFDGDSRGFRTHESTGTTPVNASVEFDIKAAFVGEEYSIQTTAGTYVEYITLDIGFLTVSD